MGTEARKTAVKALIFDMDGLMIDSEGMYWSAGRRIAAGFGKTVSEKTLGNMMGRSPVESMEVFRHDLGLTASAEELLEMRTALMPRMLEDVQPMPGLMELLEAFRGRVRYGIATSAPSAFVEIVMRRLALARYFDHVQTSDGVTRGKPDPEIYLKAIGALGVEPAECVVLEDASNGALAGKRAGAYVIAVPSRYTEKQDFGFVDYRARDLADAAGHVKLLLGGAG
jgi:HAD superfamily hydrolase (TIGR01509 family)